MRLSPCGSAATRWPRRAVQDAQGPFGDNFEVIELDSSPGNSGGFGRMAHSVLTLGPGRRGSRPTRPASGWWSSSKSAWGNRIAGPDGSTVVSPRRVAVRSSSCGSKRFRRLPSRIVGVLHLDSLEDREIHRIVVTIGIISTGPSTMPKNPNIAMPENTDSSISAGSSRFALGTKSVAGSLSTLVMPKTWNSTMNRPPATLPKASARCRTGSSRCRCPAGSPTVQ